MTVFEVKGQIFEAGPGVCGSEAEAKVSGPDGKDVFVHAWYFEGCNGYTVKDESVYGRMNDDDTPDEKDCIEKYSEIDDAKNSKYYKVFTVLDQMLQLMEGD